MQEHFRRLSANYFQTRVSADESKRFDKAKKENPGCKSCTPTTFQLYLDGPPRCEWNKSAAQIFSRSFVEYHSVPEAQRGTVLLEAQKMALTCIKTIKAEYVLSQCSAQAQFAKAKEARHRERRANVSDLPMHRLPQRILTPELWLHIVISSKT